MEKLVEKEGMVEGRTDGRTNYVWGLFQIKSDIGNKKEQNIRIVVPKKTLQRDKNTKRRVMAPKNFGIYTLTSRFCGQC